MTIKERWDAIKTEYTEKGTYAQTQLRSDFMTSKVDDKGNVRKFLEGLRVKREELDTLGVTILEDDYRSTIISSLPVSLSNFASNQLLAAKMFTLTKTIDPNVLIITISEEYDRQKSQRGKWAAAKAAQENVVLSAESSKDKGKGRQGGKKKGVCFNCSEEGHWRNKCPKLKKKNEHSTDAVESNSDDAFEADDDDDSSWSSDDTLPPLYSVSESEESDWFSEEEEEEESDWFSVDDDDTGGDELKDLESEEHAAAAVIEPAETVSEVNKEEDKERTELYDSGCTQHITLYRSDILNYVAIPPKFFRAANKGRFSATGMGELLIDIPNGSETLQLRLFEVLFSPDVPHTLVSVSRLDDTGYELVFGGGHCVIRRPDGQTIGKIPKVGRGLYRVEHEHGVYAAMDELTVEKFHRRMGHISPELARRLVEKGYVHGVRLVNSPAGPFFCESCVYGKATRKPVSKYCEGERATEFGGEIHSDLWGPAPVASLHKKKYYISFVDDNTRWTYLHFLGAKSDAFGAYKIQEAEIETQHGVKIKILHSDRGGEYLSDAFTQHLKKRGTKQKLTVHDTPQHNGLAECRNRTILERVRAVLHASGLPRFLWAEAARHIVWLMNRTGTKALNGNITPFEALYGQKPNLRGICEWGEKVWVRLEVKGFKLGGRVKEGCWVGVDDESK